jgi:hypothetical protein
MELDASMLWPIVGHALDAQWLCLSSGRWCRSWPGTARDWVHAYLTGRSLPVAGWLSRQWLRS